MSSAEDQADTGGGGGSGGGGGGSVSNGSANSSESTKSPDVATRVVITESDLGSLSAGELVARWRRQDTYIDALEQRLARQEGR